MAHLTGRVMFIITITWCALSSIVVVICKLLTFQYSPTPLVPLEAKYAENGWYLTKCAFLVLKGYSAWMIMPTISLIVCNLKIPFFFIFGGFSGTS